MSSSVSILKVSSAVTSSGIVSNSSSLSFGVECLGRGQSNKLHCTPMLRDVAYLTGPRSREAWQPIQGVHKLYNGET